MGTFSWFLLIHHFREDCRLFLCAETRHTSDFVALSVRRATPVDRLHSPLPPPFSSRRWELDRLFPVGVRWRSAPRHLVAGKAPRLGQTIDPQTSLLDRLFPVRVQWCLARWDSAAGKVPHFEQTIDPQSSLFDQSLQMRVHHCHPARVRSPWARSQLAVCQVLCSEVPKERPTFHTAAASVPELMPCRC